MRLETRYDAQLTSPIGAALMNRKVGFQAGASNFESTAFEASADGTSSSAAAADGFAAIGAKLR